MCLSDKHQLIFPNPKNTACFLTLDVMDLHLLYRQRQSNQLGGTYTEDLKCMGNT